MVKEINWKGKIVFTCSKCGWMYKTKRLAEECEAYCNKHKACSLELTKHAIKINNQGGKS